MTGVHVCSERRRGTEEEKSQDKLAVQSTYEVIVRNCIYVPVNSRNKEKTKNQIFFLRTKRVVYFHGHQKMRGGPRFSWEKPQILKKKSEVRAIPPKNPRKMEKSHHLAPPSKFFTAYHRRTKADDSCPMVALVLSITGNSA